MATTTTKKAAKPASKSAPVTTGTPLTPKIIAKLKEININATTDEEARKKLFALFAKHELTDVGEEDPTEDLIAMAGAFESIDETSLEVDTPSIEEEDIPELKEIDATVEEEEEEPVKVSKKTKSKKQPTAKVIKIAEPEEETSENADKDVEDLVEEVEEKQLTIPKKAKKPETASPKKAKAGKSQRAHKLQGKHWNNLTDAEKEKSLKVFRKVLSEKEYNIHLLYRGFTVKYIGISAEHHIFKYASLRLLEDGKLEGFLISNKFKDPDDLRQFLPDDLGNMKLQQGDSCSYVFPIGQDAVIELLTDTDFINESVTRATKQDIKMNNNRKKLEAQLLTDKKSDKTKSNKGVPPKGVKIAEIPEEEEEEPVVKITKSITKKKPVSPAKPVTKTPVKAKPKPQIKKTAKKK